MNLSKLLDTRYLFEIYPTAGFDWIVRIALLVIFVGGIVLAMWIGKKYKKTSGPLKKVWEKLEVWGYTTGTVGLLLIIFREVRALYLSQRFWLLLWILVTVLWLIYIAYYWKRVIPSREEQKQQAEKFERWLPKKKK